MEKDTRIANAIQKFVDKPWVLCEPDKGYDCLNTLVMFYEEMGVKLPLEFEGYKYEDYKQIWEKDFKKALKILKRWYRTLGKPIDPGHMERGDLLLFDAADGGVVGTATGIYLGNGNVLMVFGKQGVKVLPYNKLKFQVSEVRRLI